LLSDRLTDKREKAKAERLSLLPLKRKSLKEVLIFGEAGLL
jgi:hypothetical protein